jgi:hypothetical protein
MGQIVKIRTILAVASVAVSTLAGASAAQADELVVNGGFETGDFSGWSQFGNTGWTHVGLGTVADGNYSAEFGPVTTVGGITQNLTTVAGGSYLLQFDLQNDGGPGTSFSAQFGGDTVLSLTNPGGFGYTHYSYNVTAVDALTQLSFGFRNDPYYFHLDNVSVQTLAGAVPEPATWATLILGLGMVGGMMRRRRSLAAA